MPHFTIPGLSARQGSEVAKPLQKQLGTYNDLHLSLIDRHDGFTVWYETEGKLVGVLMLNADEDYSRAEVLIRHGDPVPLA